MIELFSVPRILSFLNDNLTIIKGWVMNATLYAFAGLDNQVNMTLKIATSHSWLETK